MKAKADEDGQVLTEQDRVGVSFSTTPTHSQRLDWLHRGTREPLASMGLYHYAMYAYSRFQDASRFDPADFATYRFADTYAGCARRVQKLRVDEMFRVPRLFGFTMPTREHDPLRNCLFKSVLFRPIAIGTEPCSDEVAPYLGLVDHRGLFQDPWDAWYAEQRALAKQFDKLQSQAGKLFTIEDVDMSVPAKNTWQRLFSQRSSGKQLLIDL